MAKTAEFAVVTGEARDWGRHSPKRCQSQLDLILVALPGTGLPAFAEELRHLHGVSVLTSSWISPKPNPSKNFSASSWPTTNPSPFSSTIGHRR